MNKSTLEFRWSVSRGRDSYGYNICTLLADGRRVARCNGGGYDMKGTCLGNYLAAVFADRLAKLTAADMPAQSHWEPAKNAKHMNDGKRVDDGRYFYGLTFVDPSYDAMSAKLERADGTFTTAADVGKTFRELKQAGKIVDLDLIRSEYRQRSPVPTDRHTYPVIDGACGFISVEQIAKAIGLTFEFVPTRGKNSVYLMHDDQPVPA